MKKVTIEVYTAPSCAACVRAKTLLDRKLADRPDIDVVEFDLRADPGRVPEMVARAGGRKTIPQIFIDGVHIGGSDDLAACERSGELDLMLGTKG